MFIRDVEIYISILNVLYFNTGFLIEADTNLYEFDSESKENKVVAKVKWNNDKKVYYAEYKGE